MGPNLTKLVFYYDDGTQATLEGEQLDAWKASVLTSAIQAPDDGLKEIVWERRAVDERINNEPHECEHCESQGEGGTWS